jgi:hypothetical protein
MERERKKTHFVNNKKKNKHFVNFHEDTSGFRTAITVAIEGQAEAVKFNLYGETTAGDEEIRFKSATCGFTGLFHSVETAFNSTASNLT